MPSEPTTPAGLREAIAADLKPVRPLLAPWKRVLVVGILGVVLLVAVPAWYAMRSDGAALGASLTWGASLLQVALGLGLAFVALRLVVPGRGTGTRTAALMLAAGVGTAVVVTLVTWWASPTTMPARVWMRFTVLCFRYTVRDGLPVLILLLILAARGALWRPALTGTVAGLAAGLVSDAGWRLVCGVSDPQHVLAGHVGGVVALMVGGAMLASIWARLAGTLRPLRHRLSDHGSSPEP